MKKLFIILLCFASLSLYGTTYYVSTTGSDGNAGTIGAPWYSWQKAFNTATAGDSVFFRGGVWYSNGMDTRPVISPYSYTPHGNSGTAANPIWFGNYPGEVPILDCAGQTSAGSIVSGIRLVSCQFIIFEGLTIRNVFQRSSEYLAQGISIEYTANLTFKNITLYNISGRGVGGEVLTGYYDAATTPVEILYDTTRWINCDLYNLCDTLSANPGNAADGFKITIDGRTDPEYGMPHWYLDGVRVWYYTDDGFDIGGPGVVTFSNCWAMSTFKYYVVCGGFEGAIEGNGFKQGDIFDPLYPADTAAGFHWRYFSNCLAIYNRGSGFLNLGYTTRSNNIYYNNTSFGNTYGFQMGQPVWLTRTNVYKNNIAYNNWGYEAAIYRSSLYTESHNTWDATQQMNDWPGWVYSDTVTVTDADFIGLDGNASADSSYLDGLFRSARQSNGSLPGNKPLQLATGSDLIDAGKEDATYIEFGLIYNGDAPDIGYAEYGVSSTDSTAKYITAFSLAEQTGVAVIDTTAKTVAIEVEYGTDVTGLIATFSLSTGATAAVGATPQVSGVTANNFTSPVTYVVTDLNTNTANWTVTVTVEDNPVPTVATVATTSVSYTAYSANVTGRIYSANGGTLTARGVCWSISASPTTSDRHTTYSPYVGSFTDVIRGLRANTTYHVRAYGTTSEGGTSYGDDVSFTTLEYSVPLKSGKVLLNNGNVVLIK